MKKRTLFLLILLSNLLLAQKPELVVSNGHADQINTVDISHNAEWIASGGVDKLVKIIHVASGKELRTLSGNSGRIEFVKFDPTVEFIGATINSGAVKFWNIASGEEVFEFPASSTSPEFFFCLNNEKIAYINDDNYLTTIRFRDGTDQQTFESVGLIRIAASNNSKTIFGYDYQSNLFEINIETGEVLRQNQLFKEFKYITCRMGINDAGKYLAFAVDGKENGKEGEIHIVDISSLKEIGVLKGHKGRIFDMKFKEKSDHLITTDHFGETKVWDISKMKEINSFRLNTFSSFALDTHPFEDIFIMAEHKNIHYVDLDKGAIIKTFKSKGNKVVNMSYDQKGKYMASSTLDMQIKIWDLEQNKVVRTVRGFWPVAFSPSGKDLISMGGAADLAVWDPLTGEKKFSMATDAELIQNVSFNSDGTLLSGAGFYGIVKIWDLEKKQIIQRLTGHVGGIYGTTFSPDGKYLASSGMDQTVRIWNLKTGKEIHQMKPHEIIVSDVKYSPDGKILASSSWDKTIKLWNTETWELIKTLEGHTNMITSIDFSPDGKFLASASGNNSVWEADNSIIIWNVETGEMNCKFQNHIGVVNKVIFDKKGEYVYSCGDDGLIKVWRYKDCQEVATMVSVNVDDYIMVTPDHYYMASKNALEAVSFRLGKDLYPFEQFDLKLNRPDIVASRIGKTPQGLINAYEYLYKKRLRKMGFTEDMLGEDFHLPETKILTENIPLTTEVKKLKFKVKCEDSKYNLDRINVYVNDVPFFGLGGIKVKQHNTKSIQQEIELELMPGDNKIQVSVLNEKGAESLRETFSIIHETEFSKGDLYLITIGVSEYQDKRFNLKYPTKDARDVISTLKQSEGLYKMIHQKELLDAEVTKENIIALSDFLKSAGPDDAVILFIAGHGVLDSKLDYYYATYDIDFDNPSLAGLPYEELELILSKVAAFRKLLIMDTCHSGELDKEEVEQTNDAEVEVGDVGFRAAGAGVRAKTGFGMENTAELMENLFSDVRKGTGATVISSAGGAEFAMESSEWKNGLFTFCFLKGLTSKNADLNKDGEIHVSELRQYVYDQVYMLSNGMQRPTARSENLSLDYRLW